MPTGRRADRRCRSPPRGPPMPTCGRGAERRRTPPVHRPPDAGCRRPAAGRRRPRAGRRTWAVGRRRAAPAGRRWPPGQSGAPWRLLRVGQTTRRPGGPTVEPDSARPPAPPQPRKGRDSTCPRTKLWGPPTPSGSPAARPPARPPSTSPRPGTAGSSAGSACPPTPRSRRPWPPRTPCATSSPPPRPTSAPPPSTTSRAVWWSAPRRSPSSSPRRTASRSSGPGARSAVPCPCSASPPRRPAASTAARPSGSTPTWAARAGSPSPAASRKGVVLGIAPFNFPLNLCAHKVAPAIAAGAPIILKPAPATPLSGLILGELLAETEPAGRLLERPAGRQRQDARAGPGRAPAGHLLHRLRQGRLRDHGLGAAQALHPGARRQRRGRRPRRLRVATPTWTGPRPGSRPSPTTRAASPASRCSA